MKISENNYLTALGLTSAEVHLPFSGRLCLKEKDDKAYESIRQCPILRTGLNKLTCWSVTNSDESHDHQNIKCILYTLCVILVEMTRINSAINNLFRFFILHPPFSHFHSCLRTSPSYFLTLFCAPLYGE